MITAPILFCHSSTLTLIPAQPTHTFHHLHSNMILSPPSTRSTITSYPKPRTHTHTHTPRSLITLLTEGWTCLSWVNSNTFTPPPPCSAVCLDEFPMLKLSNQHSRLGHKIVQKSIFNTLIISPGFCLRNLLLLQHPASVFEKWNSLHCQLKHYVR